MQRPVVDHFPELPYLGLATQFAGHIVAILDRIELFDGFDETDVAHLATYMPCYRAPAGAPIIREDDIGDFLVLVLSGIVEITKRDGSGIAAPLSTVGAGKTLGEMSVIDGQPRFASCVALEDAEFAVLDRDHLTRIIADDPRLGNKLLIVMVQLLSQRLRSMIAKLSDHPEI